MDILDRESVVEPLHGEPGDVVAVEDPVLIEVGGIVADQGIGDPLEIVDLGGDALVAPFKGVVAGEPSSVFSNM